MAIYRSIQTTFWTDAKVSDEFTPEDKYFYLYLFTNPHTNLCGCYEIGKKQVSWETGYSIDTIERLVERFEKVHQVIRFSANTREILLINWHKYNWTKSEKFRKPLLKEIESIKCQEFKEYLMGAFEGEDTVSIGYQYPMDTTVTVSVTDTVSDTVSVKENKSNKFIPPTIDEVDAYCKERKNGINPEAFYDFYESKGWMVGKNKMKDWKACVRTWEKRENPKPQPQTKNYDSIFSTEHQAERPYHGFPPEWFNGDQIDESKVHSVIRPVVIENGWYKPEEISAKELIEIWRLRRQYCDDNGI